MYNIHCLFYNKVVAKRYIILIILYPCTWLQPTKISFKTSPFYHWNGI